MHKDKPRPDSAELISWKQFIEDSPRVEITPELKERVSKLTLDDDLYDALTANSC